MDMGADVGRPETERGLGLHSGGRSEARAMAQVEIFRQGPPHILLDRPCAPGGGIIRWSREERKALAFACLPEAANGRAMMFVPASGAATRMFQAQLAVANRDDHPGMAKLEE